MEDPGSEPEQAPTTQRKEYKKFFYDSGVPVEPHTPRAVKAENSGGSTEFLAANINFLKKVEKATQDQIKLQRRREDRADLKEQRDAEKARQAAMRQERVERMDVAEKRFKNVQEVLKMEGVDAAVKDAAQKVVLEYLGMSF